MTPGQFEYHRPGSVADAVALLASLGDGAMVLAGGHTLVPMMKLRLAAPEHLIDINGIGEIRGIAERDGALAIGAATTQAEALASDLLDAKCPIIAETIHQIADPQVRNCGTMGGNVANGDPGNDLPAVMMALGASYVLHGEDGERQVAAVEFYQDIYTTARQPDELLTKIRIPAPAAGHGYAYRKMKRKVGDFGTAAVAVILELDGGNCSRAAVTLTNLAATPISADAAVAALVGTSVDDAAIGLAADHVIRVAEPAPDLHGPPEFRKQMAGEMARRAIRAALARAAGG